MADATMYPSALRIFQWQTLTDPNPRLAAPISAVATTITVTAPPLESDNTTVITGSFLMGIKNDEGFVETVWVPAGAVSADGLTLTGVVRGIKRLGIDYTVGAAANASAFNQDSPVYCNVSAVERLLLSGAFTGTIASGGTSWKIGAGADDDITVTAYNADANKPFFRYDKATNAWIYSNDGTSSTPFGTGAGVTGGDGITVTAGDIDVDLTDTVIFKDARTGNEARAVVTKAADGLIDNTFLTNSGFTGEIKMWSTTTPPTNWLICDGSAISRTTYATLFGVVADSFGGGDGSTTFNLPNFKNRVPIGLDTSVKTVIDDCEANWTAGANVSSDLDAVDFKTGSNSVKLTIADAAGAGQILGYKVISVANLYGQTRVGMWLKSSIDLDAGDLQYKLDDTAAIASALETINIPALTAGVWTKVYLTLANPATDLNLISHGIYQVNDKGAFTLNIDDVAYGENYEIGATGGSKTYTQHANEMANHTHYWSTSQVGGGGASGPCPNGAATSHGTTGSWASGGWGGGLAANNMQPYMTINYIIRT